jgi:hypothetical protein
MFNFYLMHIEMYGTQTHAYYEKPKYYFLGIAGGLPKRSLQKLS